MPLPHPGVDPLGTRPLPALPSEPLVGGDRRPADATAPSAVTWSIDESQLGSPWLPLPLMWGCALTPRGGGFVGHIHDDCDELCVVVNHGSVIRHGGVERPCVPATAFLHRRGEAHGYRNLPDQEPHLWLVHFRADEALYRDCPRLADADPERRVWRLDAAQEAGFRALFIRMMTESMAPGRTGHVAAMSGWLRLILIQASRWSDVEGATAPTLAGDPELSALWEVLNEHVESPPEDFRAALTRRVPNYDSLRHRFKRQHGVSPQDHLQRMRIERARRLLLETELLIGDIAARLGYARHAEFSRAFHHHTGQTPGEFRDQPHWGIARS